MYAKRSRRPRRAGRRKVRRSKRSMSSKGAAVNTAALRENYTISVNDGVVTFNNSVELADVSYDRAQSVARAYQEFKIKYIKLTFRPSADTWAPAAGNVIPQLYFQYDKAGSMPTNTNLQTLLDMGCRPIRFDARNVTKTYVPTVLTADRTGPGTTSAGQVRKSPWLSTNANSGTPGPAWAPSVVDHLGCCFIVTKPNPLTPTIQYDVDVEAVFCFRKPLWRAGSGSEEAAQIQNGALVLPTVH